MGQEGAGRTGPEGSIASGPAFLLFRIDDRLLHGQVALGWGGPLRPRTFVLADETLARDPGAALLYEASAPDGTSVHVCRPEELPAWMRSPSADPAHAFLLVRSVPVAAECLRRGVPGPVNLGGLHLRPDARERLPYLFLTPEDERLLAELAGEGVRFYAQDLPGNPRRDLDAVIGDPPPGRSA